MMLTYIATSARFDLDRVARNRLFFRVLGVKVSSIGIKCDHSSYLNASIACDGVWLFHIISTIDCVVCIIHYTRIWRTRELL